MRAAAVRICLTGRASRRASSTLRATANARHEVSRGAVRQTLPPRCANAAPPACSTNTFQPTKGTVAQLLDTLVPRRLRPLVDPAVAEPTAFVTCGRGSGRLVNAAVFG